jgi:hypothetical protein
MTKDETLRLALEALQSGVKTQFGRLDWIEYDIELVEQAITAIKAALEAKDEPVAWMYEVNHAHTCLDLFEPPDDAYDEGTLYPLYTAPPQRKPLTDEEIDQICGDVGYGYINVARAIEAAHGIKGENT